MCEKGWRMIISNWLFHFIPCGTSSPEINKPAGISNQILTDNSKPTQSWQTKAFTQQLR